MEAQPTILFGPPEVGIRINPLGTGAWSWGSRLYWSYGRTHTESDVRGAFQASLEAGVTLFDTASLYGFGRSERLLGRFIDDADVYDKVIIATKYLPLPWRFRRNDLLRALKGSLTRLGVERVDLYQVHWPIPPTHIRQWAEALAEAYEQGLVRAVGVSNYNVDQMLHTHEVLSQRGIPLASNQIAYSLLQRRPERDGVLALCREMGVTPIAYSPLHGGLLTGKYTPDAKPPGLRGLRFRGRYLRSIQPLLALLREIGAAHDGKTSSQVALNWLICKGAVPIPGAKTAAQAQDNAGALGWALTDDELARLDEASSALP